MTIEDVTPRLVKLLDAWCPRFLRGYLDRLQASPVGLRLASGAFWSLVGTVISRGLALIGSIVVARVVGSVGFGELRIIQSTVGMFGTFAGFGTGLTATKHISEFRYSYPARAGKIMGLSYTLALISGGIFSIVMFALSPWLARGPLAAPGLSALLQISSLMLFFATLAGVQVGILSGFEAFKEVARTNIYSGVSSVLLTVMGVLFFGLAGAVWALTGGLAVNCGINYVAIRRVQRKEGVFAQYRNCLQEAGTLRAYSVPALLGSVVVGPVVWVCNAILVSGSDGYAEMGIFNAANQWFLSLMFLPTVMGQAMLPVLSERIGAEDFPVVRRILSTSIRANSLVSIPVVILGVVLSPYIMSLYGEDFRGGWLTLALVLVTAGLVAAMSPIGVIIQASGRMWIGFLMNFGWGLVAVSATYYMVRWGAAGLSGARLTAYVLHSLWCAWFALSFLNSRAKNA